LHDENGRVDKLLMTCLKPKVGLGNILEDTTTPDQGMFDPWDVIYGPFECDQTSLMCPDTRMPK